MGQVRNKVKQVWWMHKCFIEGCLGALQVRCYAMGPLLEFLRNAKNVPGVMGDFSSAGDGTFTLPAALGIVTEEGFAPLK